MLVLENELVCLRRNKPVLSSENPYILEYASTFTSARKQFRPFRLTLLQRQFRLTLLQPLIQHY